MHLFLWLATLEVKSRWRYMIALFMIPTALGTYFILWHFNSLTIIAAIIFFGWLLYKVIQGYSLD